MSALPSDVLAWIGRQVDSHRALSADAYHAQELPRAEAAFVAVNEIVMAAMNLARGLPLRYADLAAVIGNSNASEVARLRELLGLASVIGDQP